MDPVSIVTLSGGVVQLCYKIARSIYILAKDVETVEENLNSLAAEISSISRTVKAVTTTINDPQLGFAAISKATASNQDVWSALFGSIEDLQKTLERLRAKVDEVMPGDQLPSVTTKMVQTIELKISQDYIGRVRSSLHTHQSSLNTALLMVQLYAQAHVPREKQTNLWPDITRLKRMAESLPSSVDSSGDSVDTNVRLRRAAFKVASNASDTAESRTQSLTSSYTKARIEDWVNFSKIIDEGAEKDSDTRQQQQSDLHPPSKQQKGDRGNIDFRMKKPKRQLEFAVPEIASKTLPPLPEHKPTSISNDKSIPLEPLRQETADVRSHIAQPLLEDLKTSDLGTEIDTLPAVAADKSHERQASTQKLSNHLPYWNAKATYVSWLLVRCIISAIQLVLVVIVCVLGGAPPSVSSPADSESLGPFIDPSSSVGAVVLGGFSALYASMNFALLYLGKKKSAQKKDKIGTTTSQPTTIHKGRWKPSPYPLCILDFCFLYVPNNLDAL
ncbi:hypothetical protein MMC10_003803 [Thelotrema lepadinum]|nr:hypothetical protein [Thelotrema lepadinum]